MTPQKAKNLLEKVNNILEKFDGYCDRCGGAYDDEEIHRCGGGGGGYRRRRNYYSGAGYSRPTAAPLATPAATPAVTNPDEKLQKATRIANAIARKKGQASADQGLISWVMKQIDAGKFTENNIVNEVKSDLLETASMLLGIYKELKESKKVK